MEVKLRQVSVNMIIVDRVHSNHGMPQSSDTCDLECLNSQLELVVSDALTPALRQGQ